MRSFFRCIGGLQQEYLVIVQRLRTGTTRLSDITWLLFFALAGRDSYIRMQA